MLAASASPHSNASIAVPEGKKLLILSILFLAQMMESALRVFAQLFDAMSLLGLKSHFQVFEGIYPETVSY